MKKKFLNQRGITLIALVITIIVLLILAGISISMLTGQNGILNRAQEAKEKTEEAVLEEKIKLAVAEAQMSNNGYEELSTENLNYELIKDGTKAIVSDNEDGTKHILFLDEKKEYKLDSNGNIKDLNINFDTKYVAPSSQDEERNNGVIGIGTDGKIVDMDLWEWSFDGVTNGYALNDSEVLQNTEYNINGTNSEIIRNAGYLGNIADGRLETSVPSYISVDAGKTFNEVTSLYRTFYNIVTLKECPNIPTTIISMFSAFENCQELTNMNIGNNVTNINWTFAGTKLESVNYIPMNVKEMEGAFAICNSLLYANFEVPKYVEDLSSVFSQCENLKEADLILGENVKNMKVTFYYCENLEKGPDIIPENVENLTQTFQGCVKLHGEMTIEANPTTYGNCFRFVGTADENNRLIIKDGKNNRETLQDLIINSDWQKKHVIGIWDL